MVPHQNQKLRIDSLSLPQELIDFYTNLKVTDLDPPQVEAIDKGLLREKNILAVTPIISNGRGIAELVILKHVHSGGKALYITPHKSLVTENYQCFKRFESMGLKVGKFSIKTEPKCDLFDNNDIIICTLASMDYILLNRTMWMDDITIIVVDEVNLLVDPGVGPTMDVVLTKLRSSYRNQIVYLSEPTENIESIACWLNAELSVSEWKPSFQYSDASFLKMMQFSSNYRAFKENNGHHVKEIALDLVLDAVKEGMQCIILENSKENCRDYALNLSNPKNPHSKTLNDLLDVETQKGLNNKSSSIILFSRSKNSRTLANCMLNGIAYYQGDLNEAETHSVATAFNEGLIKVLFATTKLEKRLKENNTKNSNTNYFQKKLTGNNHEYMVKSQQSINIPLAKIIKRESEWYHLNNGDTYVPIYAHKQKIRNENADIPVPYGYSILLSGKNNVFEIIQEKLIYDQSENMTFCLKNEFMLRRHVLGIISSKFAKSYEEVADFFSKTFSAYTGDSIELVQDALTFLIDHDMVILNNEELKATAFGELVSSMYLDPHTAATIAKDLETAHHKDIKITEITLLHLISKTVDVRTVNLKNDIETRNVFYYALQHQHEIIDFPDLATTDEIEKKEFLETLKNTMILDAHINEIDPSTISEKYAIVTGDLPILTLSASWIATAAKNIALIKNMHLGLNNLDTRLKYGVKEQRVPMIEIDGLGLDKTRDLIKAGITSIEILKSSTFEEVEKIIGEKSAIKVFNQLQVSISPNRKYKNLLDFCNN